MGKTYKTPHYSKNTKIKVTNRNDPKILRQTQKPVKNQKLIAQVLFQAKIDTSSDSTTAGSKPREIQNNN